MSKRHIKDDEEARDIKKEERNTYLAKQIDFSPGLEFEVSFELRLRILTLGFILKD